MKKVEFNAIEKEMANFNFDELNTHKDSAIANIASAKSISDVKDQICSVWSKIGKFIKPLEAVPMVGKFVKILADLLDSLCG